MAIYFTGALFKTTENNYKFNEIRHFTQLVMDLYDSPDYETFSLQLEFRWWTCKKVWWGFRHWRHWRFSIMKISSAASGASFASRWLQLCPGEQLLSLRCDYIYWQLNSYPTQLWYHWVFFVCIFHWYFTMSNIFIINITLSSEFWIYMFMSVWRICCRLWHCGLSLWQPARHRRLWYRYYDDVIPSV